VEVDAELLARLRDGDEEAFVMLVGRYQPAMLRFARSLVGSRQVAEEAVQDAWMGVVRGIDRFEGRSSLKTWLFRILANRARSAGWREPDHTPYEALHAVDPLRFDADGQWADPVEPWPSASDARLDASRVLPFLASALDELAPRQRQVVILRDVEGLSGDEACDVLGISSGNQRILLHRGRSRLREILEGEIGKGD
jgi:RNA polymerase sigma-70 factor (ECF subfamily)